MEIPEPLSGRLRTETARQARDHDAGRAGLSRADDPYSVNFHMR